MNLNRYWLLLVTVITLFVVSVVFILPDSSSDESSDGSSLMPLEIQWRIGASQQYDVLTDASIKLNIAGIAALQTISTRLTGVLELKTLEVGASKVLVGMRLSSTEMLVNEISNPEINRALMHPFRVRFVTSGLPASFEFPATVATEHRAIIENLVRTFQVVINKGNTWLAEESNSSGIYQAEYVRTTKSSFEKTKQRFISIVSKMATAKSEISSTETFHIDAKQNWISSMVVDETIKIDDPEGFSVDATNHATLDLRTAHFTTTTTSLWDFDETQPPIKLARRAPLLSLKETEKQISNGLIALNAATKGRVNLVHRLRDLILMDESLPFLLLKALKTQDLTDRTRADLYLVLELAGSTAAQTALASVFSDASWSQLDAMRAIVALGAVKEPTNESISALWSAALNEPSNDDRNHIASTAALALGTVGKGLRIESDVNYSQLRGGLLDGAMTASNTHQRAVFVHALGNTADSDSSVIKDIVILLNDSEPEIRGATATTIGRLGSNEVADTLMQHLEQENNSDVRGALAEALVSWDQPTAPAMATVRSMIQIERDENARLNMARILGGNLQTFPENKEPLLELLSKDKSKRIRQYIAEIIEAAK